MPGDNSFGKNLGTIDFRGDIFHVVETKNQMIWKCSQEISLKFRCWESELCHKNLLKVKQISDCQMTICTFTRIENIEEIVSILWL